MKNNISFFIFSIFIVASTVHGMNLGDLFTPNDAPEDYIPSREEIIKALNFTYTKNGFIEDTLAYFVSSFRYYTSSISFLKPLSYLTISDECKNRTDFEGPEIFQFFPIKKAIVTKPNEPTTFSNNCFKKNVLTMEYNEDKTQAILTLEVSDPSSKMCKDSYVFTTSSRFNIELAFLHGKHTVKFKKLTQDELREIEINGIRVFSFCENLPDTVISIYKTIKFFMDSKKHPHNKNYPYYNGKSQEQVEREHMEFLRDFGGFDIEDRGDIGNQILPVESAIQSGDFIGLTQIDSFVSTMIMFLSGGHISHAAIALRLGENQELYVAEMKGDGLIIASWEDFCEEQIWTKHHVVHIPLKEKYRKKFNTTAAYEYFKSLYPMDYGDYNLLFPWLDVKGKNLAKYIEQENFLLLLSLIDKFDKKIPYVNFGAGLSKRLGKEGLTMSQIAIEAAKKGISFEDLSVIPEQDDWIYDNGENIICSSFVVQMYREAGVFDGLNVNFNAKEMQPKDVYLLDLFDREGWKDERPQICKDVDPDIPYCQVYGRYRLKLHGLGTVKPYNNMFEKCESVPPLYEITPGC